MSALKKKFVSLDPNSTMARAYLLMNQLKCDALPVALDGLFVGVVSMKDIEALANRYLSGNNEMCPLTVGNFMKSPVEPVEGHNELSAVIRRMLVGQTQALVVQDGVEILGVLLKDSLLEVLARLGDRSHTTLVDTLKALGDESI